MKENMRGVSGRPGAFRQSRRLAVGVAAATSAGCLAVAPGASAIGVDHAWEERVHLDGCPLEEIYMLSARLDPANAGVLNAGLRFYECNNTVAGKLLTLQLFKDGAEILPRVTARFSAPIVSIGSWNQSAEVKRSIPYSASSKYTACASVDRLHLACVHK